MAQVKTLRELMADRFRRGFRGHDTVTGFDFRTDAPLIRSRAIHAKCFECQNGQKAEVIACAMHDCPLWPYRTHKSGKKAE